MTKHQPLFPRTLITFVNLPGPYGNLEVIARDANTVELSFAGGDFVSLQREQWQALRAVVDRVFGVEVDTVVMATDAAGDALVIEEHEVVAPARRGARKTRPAT